MLSVIMSLTGCCCAAIGPGLSGLKFGDSKRIQGNETSLQKKKKKLNRSKYIYFSNSHIFALLSLQMCSTPDCVHYCNNRKSACCWSSRSQIRRCPCMSNLRSRSNTRQCQIPTFRWRCKARPSRVPMILVAQTSACPALCTPMLLGPCM